MHESIINLNQNIYGINFPTMQFFVTMMAKKWFAIVMNVSGSKLGLKTDDEIDVIEVKIRPEHIGSLRQKEGILSAYHMSTEHWISIILSGPLSPKEIHDLLAESYELTSD